VAQSTSQNPAFTILVFTKTAGSRHDSIPAGVAAIQALGTKHNFHVHVNEDATVFSDNHLAGYRCVVFLNTTGDILDSTPRRRLRDSSGVEEASSGPRGRRYRIRMAMVRQVDGSLL
jgi:Trehalose utilisation